MVQSTYNKIFSFVALFMVVGTVLYVAQSDDRPDRLTQTVEQTSLPTASAAATRVLKKGKGAADCTPLGDATPAPTKGGKGGPGKGTFGKGNSAAPSTSAAPSVDTSEAPVRFSVRPVSRIFSPLRSTL
jgi:hypothetical protein